MAAKYADENALMKDAVKAFTKNFKSPPEVAAVAPGRVNLIGEHVDYNDGFVLPMALPMVTLVVGKRNDKDSCCVLSTAKAADKPNKVEFPIPSAGEITPAAKPKWANYVKGIVQNFKGTVVGFNAVVTTSVPIGAGLSSSASLEVAMYTFLELLTGEESDKKEKALACQKAEHEFANVPCGIMDQLIATMAEKGSALYIDCRSMDGSSVAISDPDITFIIADSQKRHNLASSEYATRRDQCQKACEALGKSSLRDASLDEVEGLKETDDLLYRRAKHVVTEIARTQEAQKALQDGDMQKLGQLMNESHESLKTDYEVSSKELDALVTAAIDCPEVYGSRMTGGGFGGCTVTLTTASAATKVMAAIKKKSKVKAQFYVSGPCAGARPVDIPAGKK